VVILGISGHGADEFVHSEHALHCFLLAETPLDSVGRLVAAPPPSEGDDGVRRFAEVAGGDDITRTISCQSSPFRSIESKTLFSFLL
jgi:hypothetical protein